MVKTADFEKPFSKRRIVIYSVAGVIFLAALANFIAASWFSYDNKVSSEMYKGFNSIVIREWCAWTIQDGYITFMPYVISMMILCVESFWRYKKENHPGSWWDRHWNLRGLVIAFFTIIFLAGSIEESFNNILADQGFGFANFSVEFIVNRPFVIANFTVSLAIAFAVYGLLVWYIDTRIINAIDFFERKVWRQALVMLIFWLYSGVLVDIFKFGMKRPYWYDINFNEPGGPLEKIKNWYFDQYQHYIGQNKVNWGWGGPTANKLTPWPPEHAYQPWWKPAKGFFNPVSSADKAGWPEQVAFPSGHIDTTLELCLTVSVLFYNRKNSKKASITYNLLTALAFIYVLDVAFALLVSTSHWLSDITFVLTTGPILYFASIASVNAVLNKINKNYNMNLL